MILRLVIVGFGNVGQEFARMLVDKREWLLRKNGLDVEVLAIATKSKGSLVSKKALDIEKVLGLLKEGKPLNAYGPEATGLSPKSIIEKCDADMLIELTTLNIDSGQPAVDHIKTAMGVGMDVVTANKGPIAWSYDELRDMARARSVHLRFEGTVMDGTPVFNLVEKTLPGCEVLGLTGILNSTSNFVLHQMALGKSMDEAVQEAQLRGFAEADPSLDIDGWDASAKITALANVLMDAGTNPKKVERKGVRDLSRADIDRAAAQDKKIKLVARATREGGLVKLEVKPEHIGPESVFWAVDGTSSALTISTDLMGDVTVVESNPTVTQTAYAVFSDMLLTVESIRHGMI